MPADAAPRPPERWEHGSDFDYPGSGARADAPPAVDAWRSGAESRASNVAYWHSGRDALRGVTRANRGRFARVFFPSFYCQDVPASLSGDGVDVRCYVDAPDAAQQPLPYAALGLRAGDAIIVSNTLGLRVASPLVGALPDGVTLVEDHTHDPFSAWARESSAHFAFASLRKWLPIPDGARVWSPAGLDVPAAPALDADHAATTLHRLSGMLEKARYLAGEAVEKAAFRDLLVTGEHRIGQGAPGGMSPLARALHDVLPVDAYRASRRANFEHARGLLHDLPRTADVSVLTGAETGSAVPFALTLFFPTRERRDALRTALAAERIYGAVLWPIDSSRFVGIPAEHAALSSRVLSLHCDHRYSLPDMERVASAVSRLASVAR